MSNDSVFFAENEELRICGVGESEEEALHDFLQHLSYFHDYYVSIPQEKLIGDARRLKNLYQSRKLADRRAINEGLEELKCRDIQARLR